MTTSECMSLWFGLMALLLLIFFVFVSKKDCEFERMTLLNDICELARIDNTTNKVTFSCNGKTVTIQAQGRNIDRAFNEWF